ncbi:MAG: discoidin domain-containing protein [Aggregatilineales bacterium]
MLQVKKMLRSLWFIGLGVMFTLSVAAQTETCPELVQTALAQIGDSCGSLGRNQACYGNILINATGEGGTTLENFGTSGDVVDVTAIQTLQTAPLDVENQTWGVAVMALQANLPDTLPGQNVTIILFGDVLLENDDTAEAISADDGFSAPMQAFRFSAGLGQPACTEAPRDGVLVQAPSQTTVNLRVNGVDVEVGSTALLLPLDEDGDGIDDGDGLEVSTFDGLVRVTSGGETQEIHPGSWSVIEEGFAPREPRPYDLDVVGSAPFGLLPEQIDIPLGLNVALNKPVTVSNEITGNTPDENHPAEHAVDGIAETLEESSAEDSVDNWWGSGDFAPQWIEIDLENAYAIGQIRLLPSQFPTSTYTVHQIWGRGPGTDNVYVFLTELSGVTNDLEWIEVTPDEAWQGIQSIRVETLESDSWVSWREIEVIAVFPDQE